MRILFTITGAWGTGSFQLANGVAERLEARGHKVKLFFPDSHMASADAEGYYANTDRYAIWSFPLKRGQHELDTFPLMLPDPNPRSPGGQTFKLLSPELRSLYFDSLEVELKKVIEDFQPDVIECQHIWAMDYVVNQLGYPFISVAHNSDQMGFQFDPTMQGTTIRSAKAASFIFAVSNAVRDKVIEYYQVDEEKVIVTPCGYDDALFYPKDLDRVAILDKYQLSIPDDAVICCFAGKMSKTKGIDILLKANKLIGRNKKLHFILLGSGNINEVIGGEDESLFSFDQMHFVGHRSPAEVAEINNIADFSVIPSRSEGFCIAGLEAVACGLPLVVTKGAAVANYAMAEVVPDEDPQALAQALIKMVDCPADVFDDLKEIAIKSAQQYTWKNIIDQRLYYYQLMCSCAPMSITE